MILRGALRGLSWPVLMAVVLPLAGCGSAEADPLPQAGTAQGVGLPGSLGNPRVLNCQNRNGDVPEEKTRVLITGPDDLVAGPLVVPGLLAWGRARSQEYGANHRFKVGTVVRKGGTVTLSIPAEFHDSAGLLYSEPSRTARTPAEADHAVTFTACAEHDTVFVGGFYVLEPRCVVLEIRPQGQAAIRREISFFDGDC
ncbi:hypothetical protein [Streptosporangium sp. NPDC087985]|uniref:hypothetical protein n=1 Tax=Streptosporangium sp. NPDC087985 TaxID=3366196 RepID=UPI003818397B